MLKYHHIGIPTNLKRPFEKYIPQFKMYVSGYEESPYNIEWMRFEPDCPLQEIVKSIPHVAFEVDNLAEAIKGYEVNRSGDGTKAYDRYKEAQANREEFAARSAELDLREREGELVEIAAVDEAAAATIRITTTKLLAIGTKVAPLIVGEKNMGKIKKVIDDQIYETLNELKKLKDITNNGNGKHKPGSG